MTTRKNWRNLEKRGYWIHKFDPPTYDAGIQWYEFGLENQRYMIFDKDEVNTIIELFNEFKEAEKL